MTEAVVSPKRLFLIGDIHGCLDCLKYLLDAVEYHPGMDALLFAGDLVNRGPSSVQTLRFIKSLSEEGNCKVVLGNHDIHLLLQAAGAGTPSNRFFQNVFEAHDSYALLEWLRHQSILHIDAWHGFFLVHAGLAPQWVDADCRNFGGKVRTLPTKRRLARLSPPGVGQQKLSIMGQRR